jgi:two-component system sensor histidine kinase KdpD
LRNLLDNAVKHSPVEAIITVSAEVADDSLRMVVQNAGPPIPPLDIDRIFEKFTQSSAGGEATGSGLGLAICRLIIAGHSGEIWAENVEPRGVRFVVMIPKLDKDGNRFKNTSVQPVRALVSP